jgi:DNA-binding NtrC family response regulator
MSAPQEPVGRILYVEDDVAAARLVKAHVEKDGHSLRICPSGRDFMSRVEEERPDLCLIDLNLPDASGMDLLRQLREQYPSLPAIVVTASGKIEHAVASMKLGASDYVTKPVDAPRLSVSLRNALRLGEQHREIARLRSEVRREQGPEALVGDTPAIQQMRALIRKVGPSDATILVTGENGTGKELVARALHFSSPRQAKPFVDVNCAALAESLLESELFGHEQGAFTGASSRRRGKFEQAHGGTLLLDEIGDMPLATQAKILRVLQERSFQRVGGEERLSVDVRVLCATNQDLEKAVGEGRFRKDLYYRINTVVVEVPPLRARAADIPSLALHFMARAARHEKRPISGISPDALRALQAHTWPGNVRELEHALERAVLVCDGGEIRPEHLPPAVQRGGGPAPGAGAVAAPPAAGLVEAVERLERAMILEALDRNAGIKARAARALGITERMISYKMQNLGIDRPASP